MSHDPITYRATKYAESLITELAADNGCSVEYDDVTCRPTSSHLNDRDMVFHVRLISKNLLIRAVEKAVIAGHEALFQDEATLNSIATMSGDEGGPDVELRAKLPARHLLEISEILDGIFEGV